MRFWPKQQAKKQEPSPLRFSFLLRAPVSVEGFAKYALAKTHFGETGDAEGWLFGKEYSQIVSGSPLDFAYIAAVLPLSIRVRVIGGWQTRYALTGQEPSSDEQDALEKVIAKSLSEREEL